MPLIIAPSGKIGSGKNYIAENIIFKKLREKNLNVMLIAFADYLKILCYTKDKIPFGKLFYEKDTNSRRALQLRGEEERKTNPNMFVDFVDCQSRIMFDRGVDVIIILDVRYKNEAQFVKDKNGIIIRFNAPNRTENKMRIECKDNQDEILKVRNHISEVDLDDYKHFDHIVNNDYGNEDKVISQINSIVDKLQ